MSIVKSFASVMRTEGVRALWPRLKSRGWSNAISLGLRRNLDVPFGPLAAAIPITVRPATPVDIEALLIAGDHGLSPAEIRERRMMLDEDLGQAYVAVTSDGRLCYMQWLLRSTDNDRIQRLFDGSFPRLAADEALLECAYTPPAFRGQCIMSCAMAQIAERARAFGARWVLTFVVPDNVPSLKGCKRAGFAPHLTKRDGWRLFRRRVTFARLPDGTGYAFDADGAAASTPDQGLVVVAS